MLPKPPNGYLEKGAADQALHTFVKSQKFDQPTPLPRRVEPHQAGEFARKSLEADAITPAETGRVGAIVRFYDLRDTAPTLIKRLNKRENGAAEWQRAVNMAALLADVGDDAQATQAADYVRYLAGTRFAGDAPDQIVGAYFSLPQSADAKFVTTLLDAEEQKVKGAPPTDDDAHVRAVQVHTLKTDTLPRVERARKRKFEILALKDVARRRDQLARVYLELEVHPTTSMQPWGVLLLQRECDEASPADLSKPFSLILDLMRSPAGVVGSTGQKLPREEEPGIATRCARALEFYLGQLTPDQQKYLDSLGGHSEQDDLLWWEPESRPPADEGA
jgi:hypothetical protein